MDKDNEDYIDTKRVPLRRVLLSLLIFVLTQGSVVHKTDVVEGIIEIFDSLPPFFSDPIVTALSLAPQCFLD
jgi:hypothetical protein